MEEFDYLEKLKTTNLKRGAIAKHVGRTLMTLRNWENKITVPSKGDIELLKQILK